MNAKVTDKVHTEIERLEREEDVTIFYACESGSRAWGFESRDSDYDVRFLYAHRTEWYLTVGCKRDVIERPVSQDLDVSGWDVKKALGLMGKSNPPLLEWLQSPIQYRDLPRATAHIRALISEFYSPVATFHHYLHMAQGNYRDYLRGDKVWVKKYFYVLRPALACIWIERGMGVVPMEFASLVQGVLTDGALVSAIDGLLAAKRSGCELDRGPRIPEISDFLDRELARLPTLELESPQSRNVERLDEALRSVLIELNGHTIRQTNPPTQE